jgi:hypothetical protein
MAMSTARSTSYRRAPSHSGDSLREGKFAAISRLARCSSWLICVDNIGALVLSKCHSWHHNVPGTPEYLIMALAASTDDPWRPPYPTLSHLVIGFRRKEGTFAHPGPRNRNRHAASTLRRPDGTLVKSDTLHDSALAVARHRGNGPQIPGWLIDKAALKRHLPLLSARRSPSALQPRTPVYLEQQRATARPIFRHRRRRRHANRIAAPWHLHRRPRLRQPATRGNAKLAFGPASRQLTSAAPSRPPAPPALSGADGHNPTRASRPPPRKGAHPPATAS